MFWTEKWVGRRVPWKWPLLFVLMSTITTPFDGGRLSLHTHLVTARGVLPRQNTGGAAVDYVPTPSNVSLFLPPIPTTDQTYAGEPGRRYASMLEVGSNPKAMAAPW